MIYFGNAQGDITKIISEPIYQGSNNASDIVFIAPFSNVTVCVAFVLPNGIITKLNIMNKQVESNMSAIDLSPCDIKNSNGTNYNAWRYLVDRSLTEYAGVVKVQFYVFAGSNTILSTYTATFNVQKGVKPTLPEPDSAEAAKSYNDIYNYLAQIDQDMANVKNEFRQEINIIASESGMTGTLSAEDVAKLANYPFVVLTINDVYTALPEAKIGNKYIFQEVEIGKDEVGAYAGKLAVEITHNTANDTYTWKFVEEYEDILMKEIVTLEELQTLLTPDNAAKMVVIQPTAELAQTNIPMDIINQVCGDFFIINPSGEISRNKQIIVNDSENGILLHNVLLQITTNSKDVIIQTLSFANGVSASPSSLEGILNDTYFNFYIYK